jgi:beta-lactamase regulating signal transducer with metallopeptidase domain
MPGFVVDVVVRSTLAAALVGGMLWALRVRSGAARHGAWTAVLLTMLAMPALTAVVPPIEVAWPAGLPGLPGAVDASFDRAPAAPPTLFEEAADGLTAPATDRRAAASTTPALLDARAAATPPVDWLIAARAVYLAVAAILAARLVVGWFMTRRLIRSATRLATAAAAPVFESNAIAAPVTTGVLRPSIVLPRDWRRWSPDTMREVLEHENAHVRRQDLAVQFAAQVNRTLYWFHPLAWWLERRLAVSSEQACDDAVLRAGGEPKAYAETLLQMAEAVSHRGRRVAWSAIGMDGSGLLGARVDRVLRGDAARRMSWKHRVAAVGGCALVLSCALACRPEIAAEPLRPDPEIQKEIEATEARAARHKAAIAMTVEEAAALERALEATPDDVEAREQLIVFYDQGGKVTWEEKLSGIRRHALWRLAHLPETDLWIPHISKRYDPDGYAQAAKLWTRHVERTDVSAKTLGRAAAFFDRYDKPVAEELLLRARRIEPSGPWAGRLGDLYARAIVGSIDPVYGKTDPEEGGSPFAAEARRRLEATADPDVLAAAGRALLMRYSQQGAAAGAADLGRRCLERAAALDPQHVRARRALADAADAERRRNIQVRIVRQSAGSDQSSDARYEAIAALPEDDRLFYLPGAAESAYLAAEYADYTAREQPEAPAAGTARSRAAAGFARAGQFARDTLTLAAKHPQAARGYSAVYRAHTVLGVLALREGDRHAAVEHMRTAAAAPIAEGGDYASRLTLRFRLAEYLLRAGERESVARYLEASADRFPPERESLLADAASIRAGMMPHAYQYAEARR